MALNPELQALLPGLNDNREGMRNFAIKKAAQLNPEIAPQLLEMLSTKDGYLADSAAHVLQLMGQPAVPYMLHAMNSTSDRKLRWSIAAILSDMGPEARAAVDKARPISARMSSVN